MCRTKLNRFACVDSSGKSYLGETIREKDKDMKRINFI